MSPVCDPSIAAIIPISLPVEVLVAVRDDDRVAAHDHARVDGALGRDELQTFSPVCALMAWMPPSPSPTISSRVPLIVAMVGAAYAVSYGRPPGFAT